MAFSLQLSTTDLVLEANRGMLLQGFNLPQAGLVSGFEELTLHLQNQSSRPCIIVFDSRGFFCIHFVAIPNTKALVTLQIQYLLSRMLFSCQCSILQCRQEVFIAFCLAFTQRYQQVYKCIVEVNVFLLKGA